MRNSIPTQPWRSAMAFSSASISLATRRPCSCSRRLASFSSALHSCVGRAARCSRQEAGSTVLWLAVEWRERLIELHELIGDALGDDGVGAPIQSQADSGDARFV